MIFDYIKKISTSSFGRDFFKLSSGTALAQIIPFFFILIISRIYTPLDFGNYARYLVIIGLLGIGSSGKLELAIVPERHFGNRIKLFYLSLFCAFIFFILIAFIFLFFPFENILVHYNLQKYLPILKLRYFIPIGLFLFVYNQINLSFFSAFKRFSLIGKQRILQSLLTTLLMVILGIYSSNKVYSLIFSSLLSFLTIDFIYLIQFRKLLINNKQKETSQSYLELFKSNINFPLFSMPMSIVNYFCSAILSFSFIFAGFNTLLGFLAQAEKVIKTPLNVLSNSLSHVFYQKISEYSNKDQELQLYRSISLGLLLINFIIFLPLLFFGEDIFAFLLGENWRLAGKFAALLLPLYCISTVVSSVSNVYSKHKKNHLSLLWQIIYFIVLGSYLFFNIDKAKTNLTSFLFFYVVISSIMYLIFWIMGSFIIKREKS